MLERCRRHSRRDGERGPWMPADLLADATALAGDIAELRHAIHREPELGLELPRTQSKVLGALDGLPLEISCGRGLSSVVAVLRGGVLSTRPGTIMAAADTFEVTVHGRGGHASQPHNANDPIPAACEIVTALQTMVTRKFNVFDPVVLTVGSFHAGTVDNVIP